MKESKKNEQNLESLSSIQMYDGIDFSKEPPLFPTIFHPLTDLVRPSYSKINFESKSSIDISELDLSYVCAYGHPDCEFYTGFGKCTNPGLTCIHWKEE
jgi:hypothetical protein